jgi:hypothetical protein
VEREVRGFTNKNLLALGVLLESAVLALLVVTGLNRGSYLLEIFFWLPFAIYLFTIWRVSRTDAHAGRGATAHENVILSGLTSQSPPPTQQSEESLERGRDPSLEARRGALWPVDPLRVTSRAIFRTAAIILLFAFIFHATLLFSPSPLSNDIYRYYWDGKVINHGLNPYAYSPDADPLRLLRDPAWEKVLNKDVRTMYPPLAQAVFAAAYFVFPGTLPLRLFSVLFNLLASGVLMLILRELRLDVRYSILYAWSPLATIEFANSGHIDSLAVLLTLLSFFALLRGAARMGWRRTVLSSVALALAVLAKVYPLLFAALFFPRWGKKSTLIFAGVASAFYLPFLGAGAGLYSGSSYFAYRGLFNGSLFPLLLAGMDSVMERSAALRVSKILVLLIFICLLVFLYSRLRRQGKNDLLLWKYAFWLTGAFLLLTPTMHPWYLTWVLPFLCFFRSPGWILLTGTAILARWIYIGYDATGVWMETWWIRLCEYIPPYLLMFYGLIARIKVGAPFRQEVQNPLSFLHDRGQHAGQTGIAGSAKGQLQNL